jgi:hypothetical protein
MAEDSRRFTDREVALVLRRATEMDDVTGSDGGASAGLSLEDLKQIAGEVGISTTAIERAVASLDRPAALSTRLVGAPAVRKALHVVPGTVGREEMAALVATVDDHADGTGSVTEALGSVRWTARDRFKSTRVSITPRVTETAIEVVEKAEPRMRRIFNLLPGAWGAMIAAPLITSLAGNPLAMIGVGVGGMIAGVVAGRGAWSLVSAASERRVKALAARLADQAVRRTERGVSRPPAPDGQSPP